MCLNAAPFTAAATPALAMAWMEPRTTRLIDELLLHRRHHKPRRRPPLLMKVRWSLSPPLSGVAGCPVCCPAINAFSNASPSCRVFCYFWWRYWGL